MDMLFYGDRWTRQLAEAPGYLGVCISRLKVIFWPSQAGRSRRASSVPGMVDVAQ